MRKREAVERRQKKPQLKGPHSFRSERTGETVVRIFQGEYYVTNKENEVLSTVLGSCIAVCIRDPQIGFGGMNHFLLPFAASPSRNGFSLRYGTYSIERLINAIVTHGGVKERLEVKVFGGGNVLKGMAQIGSRNAEFVDDYMKREGLTVAARHLGGDFARRIRYYPTSGRVMMGRINSELSSIGRQEFRLLGKNLLEPTAGKTVIFPRT